MSSIMRWRNGLMGLSVMAITPVSHGVSEPHDLETGRAILFIPTSNPPRARSRWGVCRESGLVLGGKAANRGSGLSGAEAHGPAASFDHLFGAGEYGGRNVEAQRPRGLEIDGQAVLGRLLNGQFPFFCSAVIFGFRPGTRPCARASCGRRACARGSCSMRPAGPDASIDSVNARNFAPAALTRSSMVRRSWGSSWNRI